MMYSTGKVCLSICCCLFIGEIQKRYLNNICSVNCENSDKFLSCKVKASIKNKYHPVIDITAELNEVNVASIGMCR